MLSVLSIEPVTSGCKIKINKTTGFLVSYLDCTILSPVFYTTDIIDYKMVYELNGSVKKLVIKRKQVDMVQKWSWCLAVLDLFFFPKTFPNTFVFVIILWVLLQGVNSLIGTLIGIVA